MNEPIPVSLAKTVLERAIRECDAVKNTSLYLSEPPTPKTLAWIGVAYAGFRSSLEYLRLMLGREDRDYPVNEWISQAVAPLIQHYDATAPGWRTE